MDLCFYSLLKPTGNINHLPLGPLMGAICLRTDPDSMMPRLSFSVHGLYEL